MLRALNHRNYRLFISGQLISLIGTWMQSVAQAWLVYRLTGSPVLLGAVGFAGQIPVFLLAPVGGLFADRHDRRRLLLVTQSVSMLLALVLGALTLSGRIDVWHVATIAALLGVVNGFDIPTRQAFVTELVGRQDLVNAIALNSSMFNGARIVGPAVAGVVVAAVGEGWCFVANGVSYLAVLTGLLSIRRPVPVREGRKGTAFAEASEGFRFAADTAPVRALLLLLGLVSLTGMPYAVLMPVIAASVLGVGASGLGMLMGASGAGALAGALVLARRRSVRGLGRWVATAAGGFGSSLILFSFSRSFLLSVILLLPVGFTMMIQMSSSNTLIQSMVPDRLRGRVMAVYSMMFMGMAPFGALLAGLLADRLGAPATIAIGGGLSIGGAIVFRRKLPLLGPEARRLIIAQEAAAGDPPQERSGT
ncbi:MAG TPA: MFS transporter [Gemmatimonadales bacterium]|nr:MFS transporter [Gemmatimonadales bacterium]